MIRWGKPEDLIQIDAFDKFGGDRKLEIVEKRLQVYVLDNTVAISLRLTKAVCAVIL